jgi:hypothetical protein
VASQCTEVPLTVPERSLGNMAGGMSAGRGESLAQRVANTRARQAQDAATAAPQPVLSGFQTTTDRVMPSHSTAPFHSPRPKAATAPQPPQVTHCWYLGPYGRQAALLVRWRQVGGGYDGLIVVAVPDGDGWALVEMWVESNMLEPACPG